MNMTLEDYQDQEYDYPIYCKSCDEIVGHGLEPDANPGNCPDYQCPDCDEKGSCYGMESAMMCELIKIEE